MNSSGRPLRFGYDERARMTSWTDTNGSRYDYAYDERDRCLAQGGEEGHLTLRLSYDETDPETGHRITTATTATGATHRYLINDAHQVVAEIDPLGAVTRYERDRYNRLLSHTDPLGHTTRLAYDEAGNLTKVVRPDGRASTAEYNALGLPLRVVHPDGRVVRQTYDERGNRTSVTDPSGGTTRFTYDEAGRLTSVRDALGHTTSVRCDARGLPITVEDPLGARTHYTRDAFGRPRTVTDALGAVTRLEWTPEGKPARRVDPDGAEQSWTYDGEGNCVSHTDAMGGVSRFEYTHFDLLKARTGPDGVRYEFTHDAELRLREVLNPQGLSWTYEYDKAGRLVSETDFDNRTLTYEHDEAGTLTARTNGLGERITYDRNALGQVTRKTAGEAVTTYTYDIFDELAEATAPGVRLTHLRDRYGRLLSETVNGRELRYGYDALGRRTSRTTPTGAVSEWTYDEAGRRTQLTTSGRTLTFEHDEAGRELSRHVGDTITLTHAYDALGRLTSQQVSGRESLLQQRTYTYSADGNLTGVSDLLSGPRRFTLDKAGRVTRVEATNWTEQYAYDEAGNQTSATWPSTHPGQEATGERSYTGTRITRAGRTRYEHDAQGRVVLRQRQRLSRKPDTWRYEWDAEDRLTSVTTPDGTTWRYVYDPLGRRIAKKSPTEETTFTWDGTTLCEQTTESADLPHPVVLTWDHKGLQPLTQTERILDRDAPQEAIDERFFTIVTDLVGTPSELIDESGTLAWHTRSTLWGTTTWASASTAYTPLRFPGQYFDPETGLHYNFFRYYDAESARYFSPDPLGLAPSPNPVTYVRNPSVCTDRLGLAPEPCPQEGEILYRGDMRPPEEIRRAGGFKSLAPGSDVSLLDYVVNHVPSDFVSTSRSADFALSAAKPGGYVYEIESPAGGINVNNELGPESPHPFEREIAFKGEIPFDRVTRVWHIDEFWEYDDELVVYTRGD
ncbi:RHS repeat protein [Streptomyces coeruleoprunus]